MKVEQLFEIIDELSVCVCCGLGFVDGRKVLHGAHIKKWLQAQRPQSGPLVLQYHYF